MACLDPVTVNRGEPNEMEASCRKCSTCIKKWQSYWIGRTTLETQHSSSVWMLTLTYGGGEHQDATLLNYKHVSAMFAKIRKRGFKFRYLAVGEYGKKGRAHWHIIMFWHGPAPKIEAFDERVHWKFWQYKPGSPIGFVQAEIPRSTTGCTHYCFKYLTKDAQDDGTLFSRLRVSHDLGSEGLRAYADWHLDQGIGLFRSSVGGCSFTVPGAKMRDGTPFQYYLDVHSGFCRRFVAYYLDHYEERTGKTVLPYNKYLNKALLALCKHEPDYIRFTMDHPYFEPFDQSDNWRPLKLVAMAPTQTGVNYLVTEYQQEHNPERLFYLEKLGPKGEIVWHERLENREAARKAVVSQLDPETKNRAPIRPEVVDPLKPYTQTRQNDLLPGAKAARVTHENRRKSLRPPPWSPEKAAKMNHQPKSRY